MAKPKNQEIDALNALKAITALRTLRGLGIAKENEYQSIKKNIAEKYGEHLCPLRDIKD
jgi:ATP-dependent Clp protease ATP-binding subunit ClpA